MVLGIGFVQPIDTLRRYPETGSQGSNPIRRMARQDGDKPSYSLSELTSYRGNWSGGISIGGRRQLHGGVVRNNIIAFIERQPEIDEGLGHDGS